jgi:LemA protein
MATVTSASHQRDHHQRDTASLLFTVIAIAGLSLLVLGWVATTYNRLVRADQELRSRWSQVQAAAERRAELVPELVQSADQASALDADVLSELARARGAVLALNRGQLQNALEEPKTLARFQTAQQELSTALERLIAQLKARPGIESDPRYVELLAQVQGTDDRLALERLRFNEATIAFNTLRSRFPAMLVAGAFGHRFKARPLLEDPAMTEDATASGHRRRTPEGDLSEPTNTAIDF